VKNPLDECLRKFVSVEAAGVRYLGILVEVGEEEIILRSTNRWISVPVEKISSVVAVDPAKLAEDNTETVSAEDFVPGEVIDGPPAEFDREWSGDAENDEPKDD
jgi:hypothetical protein